MFPEFKQVLRMYQNGPGTKYYFQNVYGGNIFDDISTKDKIILAVGDHLATKAVTFVFI